MSQTSNDHVFTVNAGQVISDGKANYPDIVRLRIPKDEAITFAMNILRRLDSCPSDEDFLTELAILGKLEIIHDE